MSGTPRFVIIAVLLALSILLAGEAWAAPACYGIAVASDSSGITTLYSSPTKDSQVLSKIRNGEAFLVISREGNWYRVFSLDNNIGYVPASMVNIRWKDAKGIGIIADPSDYATIYSGPSGNYKALTRIREGVEFIVIGKGTWVRVLTKDKVEGYIQAGQVIDIWP